MNCEDCYFHDTYIFCFHQIESLSSIRLLIPKDLLPKEVRENTLKKVSEVLTRVAKDGIHQLDPEDDMKVYLQPIPFP